MFRARHPVNFSTSQKMPRPPRNLNPVPTWRSSDNAIRKKTRNMTRLKRCARQAKWGWRSPKCCSCHESWNASSENVALATQNDFRLLTRYETCCNVTKCLACHAKRSYVTSETSKSDRCCRTRHRDGHTAPHAKRLRTVADVNATSSEHTFHARVKREPLLRIREKTCYLRPWQALQLLRFLIRPVAGPLSQPDQGRRPYGPQPSGSRPWQKRGGECWGEREG